MFFSQKQSHFKIAEEKEYRYHANKGKYCKDDIFGAVETPLSYPKRLYSKFFIGWRLQALASKNL